MRGELMRRRSSGLLAVLTGLALLAGGPAAAQGSGGSAVDLGSTASIETVNSLPVDFLWGVSSSGFQSEGYSPDSNWIRYEAAGKTKDPVGTSADFRHRYKEDIQYAKDLGAKVYRMGVEWARLEPQQGRHDESAWAFYDDVVASIRAAGMQPMITLDHWVYPGWEFDRGGWNNADMVTDWLANARKVVDRYARYDPSWITINEPSAYLFQEISHGGLDPANTPAALDRWAAVHNGIYDYIHQVQPGAQVSSNVAYFQVVEAAIDTTFLDRVAHKLDFIGLDYYYSMSPTDLSYANVFSEPWKASAAPDGLYYALRHYAKRFPGKPLYIVENGMPTEDGKPRPDGYARADHLRDAAYWLQRAKDDGINVIGYNYWATTDNYEWGSYTPRFGLYTVDVKNDPTLERKPTEAVVAYRSLIAQGGVPTDYQPSRPPTACSLVDGLDSCLSPAN
jgi:beta-glucosidase